MPLAISNQQATSTLPPQGEAAPWDFPGWGHSGKIVDLGVSGLPARPGKHKPGLGTWRATAICGNDISSSVLYVSALCAAQAGILAPTNHWIFVSFIAAPGDGFHHRIQDFNGVRLIL